MARRRGLHLASVMARRNVAAGRIGAALGVALEAGPRFISGGGLGLVGTGPGSWLAVSDADEGDWPTRLETALAGLASICDQSGGYALYRFAGEPGRALLQRGAHLDLRPASFGPGSAASTVIAHMGVILWQADEGPSFDLAVFRSFAGSFEHWVAAAASGGF